MAKPVILVTGANGQLGREIQALSVFFPQFEFVFPGRELLSIDNTEQVQAYFKNVLPAFCINCAAYTAVDKAETDKEMAMLINGTAVGTLAAVCKAYKTRLIHISTDYVFDGTASVPYKEDDATKPVNYYGASKREGEVLCLKNDSESIIIRTSWVYSVYGNNFVKTMMRLMKERESLNVVSDQVGSPTYAADLAKAILTIIAENAESGKWKAGIYHYSNAGVISWYDFAATIKRLTESNCAVNPIPTSSYPTPAKRPSYSVMSKEKIKSVYNIEPPGWESSLVKCLNLLKQ